MSDIPVDELIRDTPTLADVKEWNYVAAALRASQPGLVSPEAWPWQTMARAAIHALDEYRAKGTDGPQTP